MYVLRNAPTRWDHWGDYADILINGVTRHLGRKGELLQLERAGPYVPPITKSFCDILASDELKSRVASEFSELELSPVTLRDACL